MDNSMLDAIHACETIHHPRLRFNGGYHDGANAAQCNWQPMWKRGEHFCPIYEAAFWKGQADVLAGTYDKDSTDAWAAYTAAAV